MNDDWEDLMPDSGENGISIGEALHDVAWFLGKVLAVLISAAIIIALFTYSIWREFAIVSFLLNN